MSSNPPKRGRPRLDDTDPSVDVHVRLPSKEYETVVKRAQVDRVTVPELIRRTLRDFRSLK